MQGEQKLIGRLRDLGPDCTLLLVTHRTPLLDAVDRVIVLEDGQVALDGPKEQLSQRLPRAKEGPMVVSNAG